MKSTPSKNTTTATDPFVGGIQTVEDRLRLVRTACIYTLELILQRMDLQASVRRAAETRFKKLRSD